MRLINSVSVLCGALALVASASAKGAVTRVQLADSLPVAVKQSKVVGSVSGSQVLNLTISLQPRFPAELQAFCDSVSNPFSPNYRHFMTPDQVGEAFGASATDTDAVVTFLKSQGMKIRLVAPDRMAILVDTTVAQAEAAFGVTLKQYGITFTGTKKQFTYRSNSTPITLPSDLVPTVTYVSGLETFTRPVHRTVLNPTLTRTLYNLAPTYAAGFQGQGMTIGISNFDGYRLSNLPLYYSTYGLPTPGGGVGSNVTVVPVGTPAGPGSPSGEGDLDIQMELGMAPLANLRIYDNGTNDIIGVLTLEATQNLANVISESWGWNLNTAGATAAHVQHLAMSAQGMTYMAATGDFGAPGVNDPSFGGPFDYPDYEPEVLQVGGSVANTDGSGNRLSEVGWSGSGGGWVTRVHPINVLPSWQVGNGVPTGNNHRLLPDVATHASGNTASSAAAYTFVFNGALNNGQLGTSFASPVFAGSLLDLEQRLQANGFPARFGRMQDLIYGWNGRADIWLDMLTGSNGQLPDATTGTCHAGWDFVTGWGVPNWDGMYTVLTTRQVSGTVTLQNYSGTVAGTSVTIQFYTAGTGTLVDTKVTTLDSSGNFTVTTTAPGGNYDVYAKCSHWLRRKSPNHSIVFGNVTGLSFSLLNGDVNGDNVISLSDFTKLRAAFASTPSDPNWNPNADLNGDGAVSLGDFTILRLNFGQAGD
jgi:subtilase family serine protease